MTTPTDRHDSNAQHHEIFKTTHWSLVLEAAETSAPEGQAALEILCQTYWPPVYAFIRRQAFAHRQESNPDDARELTQEFFADFLEKKKFKLADRARGRFRAFLVTSLKNFLTGEWRKQKAKKRGGDRWILSLDEQRETESRLFIEPMDPAITPDRAFEKDFALTLLENALNRLRREFEAAGQKDQFDAVKEFLWSGQSGLSQAEVAARRGIKQGTFNSTVHRAKRRFGGFLREEIAQIVADPADAEDELRHLMNVLGT